MAGQLTFYLGFFYLIIAHLSSRFARVGEETCTQSYLLLCKEAVFTAQTRDILVTKRLFCIMSIFGRGTFKFQGMEASLVTNGHKKMIRSAYKCTPWISNLPRPYIA